jgi:hypothetical protein
MFMSTQWLIHILIVLGIHTGVRVGAKPDHDYVGVGVGVNHIHVPVVLIVLSVSI